MGVENRVATALIAIRRILRASEFASRDLARASGLTVSQTLVLQILDKEGDVGAGRIAAAAKLSQATVTALLDRLEQRDLVRRIRDPLDGRRVTVQLTADGRHLLAGTPDMLQNQFADRFSRLADWEQAQIIAGLERVASLLDAGEIDASPILDVGPIQRMAEKS